MCLFFARFFFVFSALAIVTGNLVVEEEGQVSRALNYAVIKVSLREQGRDPGANLLNLRACVDGCSLSAPSAIMILTTRCRHHCWRITMYLGHRPAR